MIVAPEKVSKQMVKWTAGLAIESIVLVEGVVKKSPEIIKSATVGTVEVEISKVRISRSVQVGGDFDIDVALPYLWSRNPVTFHG